VWARFPRFDGELTSPSHLSKGASVFRRVPGCCFVHTLRFVHYYEPFRSLVVAAAAFEVRAMSNKRVKAAAGMSEEMKRVLARRGPPGAPVQQKKVVVEDDESSSEESESDGDNESGSESESVSEAEPEVVTLRRRVKGDTLVDILARTPTEGSTGRRVGKTTSYQHGILQDALARYNVYYIANLCLEKKLRDSKGKPVSARPFPLHTGDGIGTVGIFLNHVSL
jgi:hypothetical protein